MPPHTAPFHQGYLPRYPPYPPLHQGYPGMHYPLMPPYLPMSNFNQQYHGWPTHAPNALPHPFRLTPTTAPPRVDNDVMGDMLTGQSVGHRMVEDMLTQSTIGAADVRKYLNKQCRPGGKCYDTRFISFLSVYLTRCIITAVT